MYYLFGDNIFEYPQPFAKRTNPSAGGQRYLSVVPMSAKRAMGRIPKRKKPKKIKQKTKGVKTISSDK